MMRCVLYLRMSTDRQDCSVGQQRETLLAFASKQGHEIVGEYRDEGISGDATHKRKGFQSMIRDAADGNFDRILCWDQSRFGRFDSIEAGSWITPLRDAGVSLETMDGGVTDWDDFAGRITFAVGQEGKHAFLRDLSRNTLRGLSAKATAAKGWCGGPTPFGFRSETVVSGRARVSTFVPDEIAAPIVRRIFEEYARPGSSIRGIVESLNRDGARTPSGRGSWVRGSVHRILTNPVYRGDYVWGRTAGGRYNGIVRGEIVSRRPGQRTTKGDPIVHENVHPALVDRDLYDRVQALVHERKKETRRPARTRPLSGLVACAHCGRPMHADGSAFKCSAVSQGDRGERCSLRRIDGDALLSAVVTGLQSHILTPARLRSVKARLERLVAASVKEVVTDDTKEIGRTIVDLDRQVAEGIARIPLLPKSLVPDFAKELDRLRAQRDALVRQRTAIEDAQAGRSTPVEERAASALAAAYGLRDAVRDADPALLNHHFRGLGVSVKATTRGTRADSATVVVDPLRVPRVTCPGRVPVRDKSPGSPLLIFEVAVVRPETRGRKPGARLSKKAV
jgi:DNA invertase Pin-like site-specific DNA recombinase